MSDKDLVGRHRGSSAGFAGGTFWMLASDGGAPAPRRPAARTASWGEARKGGGAPLRVWIPALARAIVAHFAEQRS